MSITTEPMVTNQLRRLRLAQGLAQYGLAVQAKVSPTVIGAIERHDYTPGAAVRQCIAKALDVPEAEIWPGTPSTRREEHGEENAHSDQPSLADRPGLAGTHSATQRG